jgi:hypothetical protein
MSLDEWLANRWVTEHESSAQEESDLLALIDRDLRMVLARELKARVLDWLKRTRPDLLIAKRLSGF